MIRQAGIADTSLSAIDERTGDRIAALPGVEYVSGLILSAVVMPESAGFFILWGYAPNEFAIRHFKIVEGAPLRSNRQILLGRMMAEALNMEVGDTLDLSGSRFRVTGIYETGTTYEELGGVATLRDAQAFAGRPRKVTMYSVKVHEPEKAAQLVEVINQNFPDVQAALTGEFVDQMPDMENAYGMLSGISILAIIVGGVGVLNTMLMAVLERTKEIGVLRALGWRRVRILGLIVRESLLLGFLGGFLGIIIALGIGAALQMIPLIGSAVTPSWSWDVFGRAIVVALSLGLLGGLYPALRATRLEPVEAIRYE